MRETENGGDSTESEGEGEGEAGEVGYLISEYSVEAGPPGRGRRGEGGTIERC